METKWYIDYADGLWWLVGIFPDGYIYQQPFAHKEEAERELAWSLKEC